MDFTRPNLFVKEGAIRVVKAIARFEAPRIGPLKASVTPYL